MGTNYYMDYNQCAACGRHDTAHIGKSGNIVQGYKRYRPLEEWQGEIEPFKTLGEILSWRDWKRVIAANPDARVYNEYGEDLTLGQLAEIFEGSTLERRGRQFHGYARHYHPGNIWLDEDGFTVTLGDFS